MFKEEKCSSLNNKKYNIYITQLKIVYSKTMSLVYKDLVFKSFKTVVYYSVTFALKQTVVSITANGDLHVVM